MKEKTAIDVLQEAINVKIKKSGDYQSDDVKEADYFPYGKLSFVQMLYTKMMRIKVVSEKDTKDIKNESLQDSLRDIAVYAAMYSAWLTNEENKDK